MLVKFRNNLLSHTLLLMILQITVRTAIVIPLNKPLNRPRKQDDVQLSAANDHKRVVLSIRPSPLDGISHLSHFSSFSNFPQVHSSNYNEKPATIEVPLRSDDNMVLPNEESHYYYKSPKDVKNKNLNPNSKVFKIIESIYYFPSNDEESEQNEDVPENVGVYDGNKDTGSVYETQDDHRNQYNSDNENQVLRNSASDQLDETEKRIDKRDEDFEEANRFENFLENVKSFGIDSLKENQDDQAQEGDDQQNYRDNSQDNYYRESMAEHPTEDQDRDYQLVGQNREPDDYYTNKRPYQNRRKVINEKNQMDDDEGQRSRKPISDLKFEQEEREGKGLMDEEPDEADNFSESDVIDQLKKSERKYGTLIDPVYSSEKDFEAEKKLEKLIKNVDFSNKEKEKNAALVHDQHEISEI